MKNTLLLIYCIHKKSVALERIFYNSKKLKYGGWKNLFIKRQMLLKGIRIPGGGFVDRPTCKYYKKGI